MLPSLDDASDNDKNGDQEENASCTNGNDKDGL